MSDTFFPHILLFIFRSSSSFLVLFSSFSPSSQLSHFPRVCSSFLLKINQLNKSAVLPSGGLPFPSPFCLHLSQPLVQRVSLVVGGRTWGHTAVGLEEHTGLYFTVVSHLGQENAL